jgi:hypothetical protein
MVVQTAVRRPAAGRGATGCGMLLRSGEDRDGPDSSWFFEEAFARLVLSNRLEAGRPEIISFDNEFNPLERINRVEGD